jgi:calcineurin-like phosphoesterase family protein
MTAPRRFVIPDIHGCARTFSRLVHDVIRLTRKDDLYILGDMIDRGPRSREVIDHVIRLGDCGFKVRPLRGNHEQMLLDACRDRDDFRLWMLNGGEATLSSFGIEDACELSVGYREFFASLSPYLLLDDFVLVHAGLDFSSPDPFLDTTAMLWSRRSDMDRSRTGGRRLICGHTPHPLETIRRSLAEDRIVLDNGCVYGSKGDLGRLTALELNSYTLHTQDNIDY